MSKALKTYQSTIHNLSQVVLGTPVLVLGTGKASLFHNTAAVKYGTNVVASVAPNKGGSVFLGRPVFSHLREGVEKTKPYACAVFVPPQAAAQAIIDCIEAEIPLIVAFAEGIPTHDQLRIQACMRSQSVSRLIGPNCPGLLISSAKLKLGIQPLPVHSDGMVGIASRSGTISYELASVTTELGLGQSVVFGLGGDPFPGTRTAEALEWMLYDDSTRVIALVGEIGGQMEEECVDVIAQYKANSNNPPIKPIVGFIAGKTTTQGRLYGHAGAIWSTEEERAQNKIALWKSAGIVVADHIGAMGDLIKLAAAGLSKT